MAGNSAGGYKTVAKLKEKYGDDFYKKVGALGGAAPCKKPKGFAASPLHREKAKQAGKWGGMVGRVGYKYQFSDNTHHHYLRKATGEAATFPRTDV